MLDLRLKDNVYDFFRSQGFDVEKVISVHPYSINREGLVFFHKFNVNYGKPQLIKLNKSDYSVLSPELNFE